MNTALFIKFSIIFIFLYQVCGAQWIKTNGPKGGTVTSIALTGTNIFAGTFDGVYLSIDGGLSWSETSLNSRMVWSLTVSGSNILAGLNDGVYFSLDNGLTWEQSSLNNRAIYSLCDNGSNTFAGSSSYGVYVSGDNGRTWAQTSLDSGSILSLAQTVQIYLPVRTIRVSFCRQITVNHGYKPV